MLVTAVEPYQKGRKKIYIDGSFAFLLYVGEIKKFKIESNSELSDDIYAQILDEILPKRAKLRAMNLLLKHDKTKKQLEDKLREGYYPESVIEKAIKYVEDYGYIDDSRYALSYASYRMNSKSRKQLERELCVKGIDKNIIQNVLDELYSDESFDEDFTIQKLAAKRLHVSHEMLPERLDAIDDDDRNKLYRHLFNKGFSYDKIKHALDITSIII